MNYRGEVMSERNSNVDVMRIIAIFMVATIYVTNCYCYNYEHISSAQYTFALLLNIIGRLGIPCFFMITGVLLFGRQESIRKCMSRTGHYLVVLVIWSLVYFYFKSGYLGVKENVQKVFYHPLEVNLWFMYLMVPIYLMMPFFQILCSNMKREHEILLFAIAIIAILASYRNMGFYWEFSLFSDRSYAVVYLFLGYLGNKYKDSIPLKNRHLICIILGSRAIQFGWTLFHSFELGKHYTDTMMTSYPLTLIGSLALFLLIMRLGKGTLSLQEKNKIWTGAVGDCACGIYVVMVLIYNLMRTEWSIIKISPYWFIPVSVFALVVLSIFLSGAIRKCPGGRVIT